METPKPMAGTWTLTAPDGRTWQADSPLRCAANEQRERVPAEVAMQRIREAAQPPHALTFARDVLRMVGIGIQADHIRARDVEFMYSDGAKRRSVHDLCVEAVRGLEAEIDGVGVLGRDGETVSPKDVDEK